MRWRRGAATPRSWRCAGPTRRSANSCRTTNWWRCSTWATTPSTSTRSSSGYSGRPFPPHSYGEVSSSYDDGGVMSHVVGPMTPPSATRFRAKLEKRSDADTSPYEWGGKPRLFLHLGHHLFHGFGHEALALAADGVLLGGLPGGGEVVHQRMHHVVSARLLEVRHHDVAGVSLGCRARLAHQAGRPQPQHLVLARAGLELQFLVVLELVLESLFASVERRHLSRSGWGSLRRVIAAPAGLSTQSPWW